MALYRCGGGSSSGGGGDVTIKTQAEWDALTFAQQKSQGLTVIKNSANEYLFDSYDYTNLPVPIRFIKEFYTHIGDQVQIPFMKKAIVFQGMWANGSPWGNYDELQINDIHAKSNIHGNQMVFGWYRLTHMVYVFTEVDAQGIYFGNGSHQNTYASYGAILEIDDDDEFDAEVLFDYYGNVTQTYTLQDDYDAIVCLTTKSDKEIYMNGDITINGTYSGKMDGREKLYNDQNKSCTTVYFNVQSGAEFTVSCITGANIGHAIIGFKRHQS